MGNEPRSCLLFGGKEDGVPDVVDNNDDESDDIKAIHEDGVKEVGCPGCVVIGQQHQKHQVEKEEQSDVDPA